MKPKVTIGICARNCQDIIGAAIESAIKQDFNHRLMEIIMIDDGSEDITLKIMRAYKAKTDIPTKIFTGKWEGIGKARETVLNNALGEYIIWLDSDETFENSFVRKQVALMEKNPKAGISVGQMGLLQDENPVLALDLVPNMIEYACYDFNTSDKLPGTGGSTYRVVAAKEVGGFDESVTGLGEDIDIAKRMKDAGWLILNGGGVFYETHGCLASWRTLWKRYADRGVHSRDLYLKTKGLFSLYKINPLASFVVSLICTVQGYRLTRSKLVLLLPVHFTFKMTAWFYGFTQASSLSSKLSK